MAVEESATEESATEESATEPTESAEPEQPADPPDVLYVPDLPEGVTNAGSASTLEEAFGRIRNDGEIRITKDIAMDSVVADGVNVTVKSTGDQAHTITKEGESANMFVLQNGGSLTLENIIVNGEGNTKGRTITAKDESKLTLAKGAVLEKNTGYGAVYLDGAAISVEGGSIRDNRASTGGLSLKKLAPAGDWTKETDFYTCDPEKEGLQKLGGAVLMIGGSSFSISSGSVNNNSAVCGGGIYASGLGSLHLSGGEFKNNKAIEEAKPAVNAPAKNPAFNTGGAIGIEKSTDAEITVSGTDFTHNSARRGGAVYVDSDVQGAKITVSKGNFRNNHATEFGAVLYSFASGLTLDIGSANAVFEENSADKQGMIYVCADSTVFPSEKTQDAVIRIHDGAVFANNKAATGACFFLQKDSGIRTFSIADAVFSNNAATGNAGVAYIKQANLNFSVKNSNFTNNSGVNSGGCFYIGADASGTDLLMEKSTFENCESGFAGVLNLFKVPKGKFTIHDCVFTSNSAKNSAGGCVYSNIIDSKILLDGNKFISNSTENLGGAISATLTDSSMIIQGNKFIDNTADTVGGAIGATLTDSSMIIQGDEFTDNTANNVGGAVNAYLVSSSLTVQGGLFQKNHAQSGGALRCMSDSESVATVQDGALFKENSCRVNAGAISFSRVSENNGGTVQLLECDILNNYCEADFTGYGKTEMDVTSVQHYNTGGIYVGEDVTMYTYDALVTDNYVESGYTDNIVGSGIGMCPDARAFFYPDHGAMVYGNGQEGDTDILAVPYDEGCIQEGLPKLVICDTAPDGRKYNWSNLDGETARTGEYNWDRLLTEASTVSTVDNMDGNTGGYNGEDTLEPIGFKANLSENRIQKASADDGYKVHITGNYTKSALYAAGGVMINGTLCAGHCYISVEKKVDVDSSISQKEADVIANKEFTFRLTLHADGEESFKKAPTQVPFTKTKASGEQETGTMDFTLYETDLFEIVAAFTLKKDEKISIGPINPKSISDDRWVYFPADTSAHLEETDSGGASKVELSSGVSEKEGYSSFDYVCVNHFSSPIARVGKTVTEKADASAFSFLLEQITEIDQGAYDAAGKITPENYESVIKTHTPAANISYTVHDIATGEQKGEPQTTGQDGLFQLQAGQYAQLNLSPNTRWLVSEQNIPKTFNLKSVTGKSGTDQLSKLSDNLMLIECKDNATATIWNYDIILDCNGGSISDAGWSKVTDGIFQKTGVQEGSFTLPVPVCERLNGERYLFKGWQLTHEGAEGIPYNGNITVDSQMDQNKDYRLHFTAVWEYDKEHYSYTVVYDAGPYGYIKDSDFTDWTGYSTTRVSKSGFIPGDRIPSPYMSNSNTLDSCYSPSDFYWYLDGHPDKKIYNYYGSTLDDELLSLIGNSTEIVFRMNFILSKYLLTFDCGDGEVSGEHQFTSRSPVGSDLSIPSKKPTREGYSFGGWIIKGHPEKGTFQPSGSYPFTEDMLDTGSDHKITFEAVWEPLYTVVVDPGEGRFDSAPSGWTDAGDGKYKKTDLEAGSYIYTPYYAPTRTDYVFNHWQVSGHTDKTYAKDGKFTIDSSLADGNYTITLQAVWELGYTVVLDPAPGRFVYNPGSDWINAGDEKYKSKNFWAENSRINLPDEYLNNHMVLKQDGYTFAGWQVNGHPEKIYTENDTFYVNSALANENRIITLQAVWEPLCTVVLDPGEGKFTSPPSSSWVDAGNGKYKRTDLKAGSDIYIPRDTPKRVSYTFDSWKVSGHPDITCTADQYFTIDSSLADSNHTITLQAVWEPLYTVVLDPGEGRFNSPPSGWTDAGDGKYKKTDLEAGYHIYTPSDDPVRNGYVLANWQVNGHPEETYRTDEKFTIDSSLADSNYTITLQAVWEHPYTVILDPGDGKFTSSPSGWTDAGGGKYKRTDFSTKDYISFSDFSLKRDGYTFVGWQVNGRPDETYESYFIVDPALADGNRTITLQAVWEPLYTVVLDPSPVKFIVPLSSPWVDAGNGKYKRTDLEAGSYVYIPNTNVESRSGYLFMGWQINGHPEKTYWKGNHFIVDASLADENHTITLSVVWD